MDIFKDTMSEMTYEQIEKLVEENMKDIMFRWYLSLEESLFLHCLEWQRCSSIIQKKT